VKSRAPEPKQWNPSRAYNRLTTHDMKALNGKSPCPRLAVQRIRVVVRRQCQLLSSTQLMEVFMTYQTINAAIGEVVKMAVLCTVAVATLAACVSRAPYNPDHIDAARSARIAEICQDVMGFGPSEPEFENLWPGDPDPALSTNRYRACIASLSDSMRNIEAKSATGTADTDASIPEALRRERRACADIGLESTDSAFASCVRDLQNVQAAEQMNANYAN
jgi:hypothetical protein